MLQPHEGAHPFTVLRGRRNAEDVQHAVGDAASLNPVHWKLSEPF